MSAIGVFDSGLGGLTVVKAIIRQVPDEHIIYFGDTARVPYGTKSPEAIIRFSRQNAKILLDRGVKMVVVACNSSASYALSRLRKELPVPVIGVVDPGIRRACGITKNKRIGVIATPATVASGAYRKGIHKREKTVRVFEKACPLFVPLVEEGRLAGHVTEKVAEEYLSGLKCRHIDTLILGCTHYPLLKATLRKIMGPQVALVDSAQEVAREVENVLDEKGIRRKGRGQVKHRFFASDGLDHFRCQAKRFLGYDPGCIQRIKF